MDPFDEDPLSSAFGIAPAPSSFDPLDPLGAQQEFPFQPIGDDNPLFSPMKRSSDDKIRGKRPAGRPAAKSKTLQKNAESGYSESAMSDEEEGAKGVEHVEGGDAEGEAERDKEQRPQRKAAKKAAAKSKRPAAASKKRSRKDEDEYEDDDGEYVVSEEELSDDAIVDGDEPFMPLTAADDDRAPPKKGRKPEKKRRKADPTPPRAGGATKSQTGPHVAQRRTLSTPPPYAPNTAHPMPAPMPPPHAYPPPHPHHPHPHPHTHPHPHAHPHTHQHPYGKPMDPEDLNKMPMPMRGPPPPLPRGPEVPPDPANDTQFHHQVQLAASRVLNNVERRLNQNDVLLQLMQEKNEAYTMIDLILRFRFNADHALAELEQLPVRFGGRGFLPPLVNPRNFTPRDPRYIPRLISTPNEAWPGGDDPQRLRLRHYPPPPLVHSAGAPPHAYARPNGYNPNVPHNGQ